jgi:iron(III) transport system permease protein
VLWQITLRLIAPTIAATALIIFVLALSEFGVPALLRVRVFTTEVFTAFAALYDFGAGVALATPLLAVALVVSIAVRLITGERLLVTRRTMHPALVLRPGAVRIFLLIGIVTAIFISTVLPVAALLAETKTVGRIFLAGRTSAHAIANSLGLAISGATLIVTVALVLGYGRARARTRFRHLFDPTLLLIFAVPSTVLGIGLIGLWNREGLAGQIYSSQGMILIAYLARLLPVAVLMLAASVQQVPVSAEEAAEVAGATWTRRFIGIVLPQLWSALAATWIVSFIFCFGELGATLLVAPPGESTLPVRVYTLIANTPLSEVASLALLQVSITLFPLVLLALLFRKRKREMA